MIYALCLICCVLLGLSLYLIMIDVVEPPKRRAVKRVKALLKSEKQGDGIFQKLVNICAQALQRAIRMDSYNRTVLVQKLRAAQKTKTPEEYLSVVLSEAILKGLLLSLLSFPLSYLNPIMAWIWPPLCVGAGAYLYHREISYLNKTLLEKRFVIERELPRFASTIKETLGQNPNILHLLIRYGENTCPEFAYELKLTTADMQSGNYETAITNLDRRVASPLLSQITRGLIGAIRGDNATEYWERLAERFDDEQRQELRREALRIPAKVRMMSYPIMVVFMAMWLSLLIYMVMNYSQSLF